MPASNQRMLAAGLSGVLGVLPDMAIEYGAYLLRVSHATTGLELASIIYRADQPSLAQALVGTLAHLVAGGVLGLVVLLVLTWSGERYAVPRGLCVGAAFWLNHLVLVPSFVAPRFQLTRTVSESLVYLLSLLGWGATTAYLTARWGGRMTGKG